ncbi:hypothetical protein [Proteus myxofaciens]|uniref:Conjugal transfer protein TraG n=1 Tax=Proteus myxofaciens ATCC 19692 TaxID=1354337 RepID=A0A198G779_9GAMM|nr:hypothetical protein [Proteus myxofaciens]OAT32609.1 hypothetical protein M983_1281 [Proteus myxofaciens ATCC 19692]
MNLVLGAMYIVLPLFWFGAVSWSGVNLGFTVSSVISSGSKGTQQAGAQGGSAVMSLVKNIGTKSSLKK